MAVRAYSEIPLLFANIQSLSSMIFLKYPKMARPLNDV